MIADIKKAIETSSHPVLIEFFATWCTHCVAQGPAIEELRKHCPEASIFQVDGDKNEAMTEEYKVRSYPTFILFKDGQQVWRDSGRKSYSELKDMMDRFN